ncbi:hypothetical protein R1A27_04830 [Methylobacterium sp. NMS12]|uniref:hypothetical protein n=1 Tax=Methylobacterium sp. NMS12 TaxID=3079766 RepID=UPI003F881319
MADAGEARKLNGPELDFELLRSAFLALAQGHIAQAGDEGRDFLRGLESSIQHVAARSLADRPDAQATAAFDRAASRVREVLQRALQEGQGD